METPALRQATPDDDAAIVAIYNVFVTTCTSTWQTEPDTVAFRREWLAARRPEHPVFVAEDSCGRVVAFASLSPYSSRGAFDRTAEISLYIEAASQGRGLGRRLMTTLLDAAKSAGLHLLVSRVSDDQPASLALHAKCGFVERGRIPEMGFKFGKPHGLVYLSRHV